MVIQLGTEPDLRKRVLQRQGSLIRKTRKLRGLTIAEFAALLSVTDGAVSQWETGRFGPRPQMQIKIARALDVPHSMLFGLDAESAAS